MDIEWVVFPEQKMNPAIIIATAHMLMPTPFPTTTDSWFNALPLIHQLLKPDFSKR